MISEIICRAITQELDLQIRIMQNSNERSEYKNAYIAGLRRAIKETERLLKCKGGE